MHLNLRSNTCECEISFYLELALVPAGLLVQLDDRVLLQVLVQLHCSCQALFKSQQLKLIHEGIKGFNETALPHRVGPKSKKLSDQQITLDPTGSIQ